MLLWRACACFSFSFFVEINGFTILNVEHSGHYINVGLFLLCTSLHTALGLTFFLHVCNHAQRTQTQLDKASDHKAFFCSSASFQSYQSLANIWV